MIYTHAVTPGKSGNDCRIHEVSDHVDVKDVGDECKMKHIQQPIVEQSTQLGVEYTTISYRSAHHRNPIWRFKFSVKRSNSSSREDETHNKFQVERVFERALVVDERLHIRHSKESEGPSDEIQEQAIGVKSSHRSDDETNEACA